MLSVGTTIGAHLAAEFTHLNMLTPVALTWMVTAAVTDLLITVSMVAYLVRIHLSNCSGGSSD